MLTYERKDYCTRHLGGMKHYYTKSLSNGKRDDKMMLLNHSRQLRSEAISGFQLVSASAMLWPIYRWNNNCLMCLQELYIYLIAKKNKQKKSWLPYYTKLFIKLKFMSKTYYEQHPVSGNVTTKSAMKLYSHYKVHIS